VRFRVAVALSLAGAATEDGRKILEAGLAMLETECSAQILPDGGHISRSPETLADALLDIHAVEELLLRMGVSAPVFLNKLQPRMAAMLSFFNTPDGGVLPANGGGDCASGLARAALRPHGGVDSKFSFARLSAFQRVQANELTVYIDAGPGPDRPHGGYAHAGALALTASMTGRNGSSHRAGPTLISTRSYVTRPAAPLHIRSCHWTGKTPPFLLSIRSRACAPLTVPRNLRCGGWKRATSTCWKGSMRGGAYVTG